MIEPESSALDLAYDALFSALLDMEERARVENRVRQLDVARALDAVIQISGRRGNLSANLVSMARGGRCRRAVSARVLLEAITRAEGLERANGYVRCGHAEAPSILKVRHAARLLQQAGQQVQPLCVVAKPGQMQLMIEALEDAARPMMGRHGTNQVCEAPVKAGYASAKPAPDLRSMPQQLNMSLGA